jgi:hypothetical protein
MSFVKIANCSFETQQLYNVTLVRRLPRRDFAEVFKDGSGQCKDCFAVDVPIPDFDVPSLDRTPAVPVPEADAPPLWMACGLSTPPPARSRDTPGPVKRRKNCRRAIIKYAAAKKMLCKRVASSKKMRTVSRSS